MLLCRSSCPDQSSTSSESSTSNRKIYQENTTCPAGWQQFENRCYAFQLRHRLSYYDASNHCEILGAHLVTIDKPEEQKMIDHYILSRPYFQQIMNGSNDTMRDTAIWTAGVLVELGNQWHWLWQSDYYFKIQNYRNWGHGFPSHFYSSRNMTLCVSMVGSYGFKWRDSYCEDRMLYICEKIVGAVVPHLTHTPTVAISTLAVNTSPATSSYLSSSTASSTRVITTSPATTSHISLSSAPIKPARCQYPWKHFKHSCYLFKFNEKKTFYKARDACISEHSHLVFIESEKEQLALVHFLNTYPEYRAEYNHSRDSAVWTGVKSATSTGPLSFKDQMTDTKYHLTYTNWVDGGDTHRGSSHYCVAVVGHLNSGWKNYPCERTFFYACERPVSNLALLVG